MSDEAGADDGEPFERWVTIGGAAAAFTALPTQLLGRDELPVELQVAVYAFAAAIPLLVYAALAMTDELPATKATSELWMWLLAAALSVGWLAAMVGFLSMFAHFSVGAAVIFGVLSVLAIVAFMTVRIGS